MKTNNSVLYFIFFLIGCFQVQAQTTKFGIKAGVNLSVLHNTINQGARFRMGPHMGVYLETRGKNLAFQPELVYSSQGCKTSDFSGSYNGAIRLNYLNLGLIGKIYASKGFFFSAGPQIGLLMSAKGIYSGSTTTITSDIKDYFKGGDFGISLGCGYQHESGINYSIRYNMGLSNTDNIESNDALRHDMGIGNQTNRVFQFSLGYSF
jgi:hypothetical protein